MVLCNISNRVSLRRSRCTQRPDAYTLHISTPWPASQGQELPLYPTSGMDTNGQLSPRNVNSVGYPGNKVLQAVWSLPMGD